MRKIICNKMSPVIGDNINRIEACLIYLTEIKHYYMSIEPQKILRRFDYTAVIPVPPYGHTILLESVKRRSKKQDVIVLDYFLPIADALAKQMAKEFGVELVKEA